MSGNFAVESVATFSVESVATLPWNTHAENKIRLVETYVFQRFPRARDSQCSTFCIAITTSKHPRNQAQAVHFGT